MKNLELIKSEVTSNLFGYSVYFSVPEVSKNTNQCQVKDKQAFDNIYEQLGTFNETLKYMLDFMIDRIG